MELGPVSEREHTMFASPSLGDPAQIISCSSIHLPADFIIIYSRVMPPLHHIFTIYLSVGRQQDLLAAFLCNPKCYLCTLHLQIRNRSRTHGQQRQSLHLSPGSCHFCWNLVIKDEPLICFTSFLVVKASVGIFTTWFKWGDGWEILGWDLRVVGIWNRRSLLSLTLAKAFISVSCTALLTGCGDHVW